MSILLPQYQAQNIGLNRYLNFLQNGLYNAQKEIPVSDRDSTEHATEDDGSALKIYSYVTGPLEFSKTYIIKLTAVNINGIIGIINIQVDLLYLGNIYNKTRSICNSNLSIHLQRRRS